jgi:hypothetical protein
VRLGMIEERVGEGTDGQLSENDRTSELTG